MIPSKRLVALLATLPAVGLAVAFGVFPATVWQVCLVTGVLLALTDLLSARGEPALGCEREVPGSLPLGVTSRVRVRVHNAGDRNVVVRLFDHCPEHFACADFPQTVEVAAGGYVDVRYRVVPERRGEHRFGELHYRVRSPLALWWRAWRGAQPSQVRVYPNFAAVTKYGLLATEQRLAQIGVITQRRRGEGSEFHQLREYRPGDSLARVDWRASARVRKLISREYQDERDQNLIFLLDCGRRMRAKDQELSHFDQALNAILLLTYVALRKGDSVGVATFSGESRWLAPCKGPATLTRILNTLYDLQPGTRTPDYSQAALELLARQRKHALVVVVTNLRDEDPSDLEAGLHLISSRHLVVLVSLREQAIDAVLEEGVDDLDGALRLAASHEYLAEREANLDKLRRRGVLCLDALPRELSTALVNFYHALKARGAF